LAAGLLPITLGLQKAEAETRLRHKCEGAHRTREEKATRQHDDRHAVSGQHARQGLLNVE
jgi:hypothetical protein